MTADSPPTDLLRQGQIGVVLEMEQTLPGYQQRGGQCLYYRNVFQQLLWESGLAAAIRVEATNPVRSIQGT
jgi:hypothetical protein